MPNDQDFRWRGMGCVPTSPGECLEETGGAGPPRQQARPMQVLGRGRRGSARIAAATPVLVVEDDPSMAEALGRILEGCGHRVWSVESGADATATVEATGLELIVLDLGLPDVDGLVLCSTLRALTDVPIIICSASDQPRDRVLALKLGADDFIGKPFDIYEFEARVEAVLRRARQPAATAEAAAATPGDCLRVGELVIDPSRRRAMLHEESLQLTPTEYRLLSVLASRPEEIFSRDELAQQVWGYQEAGSGRTIDVHVRRLRLKLGLGTPHEVSIVAVRGFGYKVAPGVPAQALAPD